MDYLENELLKTRAKIKKVGSILFPAVDLYYSSLSTIPVRGELVHYKCTLSSSEEKVVLRKMEIGYELRERFIEQRKYIRAFMS